MAALFGLFSNYIHIDEWLSRMSIAAMRYKKIAATAMVFENISAIND
jgi:hypothetical protein